MGKFRKKPVVIEATKFLGGLSFDEMTVEWGKPFTDVASYEPSMNTLEIDTLEGVMRVNLGDFVIKGIQGEFYACKPDIFDGSYELVTEKSIDQ